MEGNASALLVWLWAVSWQTALLAAVVVVVTRLCRRAPAAWRHALWLLVVVKFLIPPVVPAPTFATPSVTAMDVTRFVGPSAASAPAPAPVTAAPPVAATAPPAAPAPGFTLSPDEGLTGVWLAGVLAMLSMLLWRVRQQSRLLASAEPVSDEVEAALAEAAAKLGMRRVPRIVSSPLVHTPMLVGVLRPTVLLPTSAENSLSEGELRATLLHELAHAKRLDVAALWLYQLVQLAFFFHPALWLSGRQMRKERELACDEMVLSLGGVSREEYASGYVQALKSASAVRAPAIALAMAEPFEMEKRRLELILHSAIPRLTMRWVVPLLLLCAAGLLTVGARSDGGRASAPRFHINDRVSHCLKGRVKTVTTYAAQARSYLSVGKRRLVSKDEYSPEGLLMETTTYTPYLTVTTNSYDNRGLLVSTTDVVTRTDPDRKLTFREVRSYSAVTASSLDSHRVWTAPTGITDREHVISRYRPDGQLLEETEIPEGKGMPLSSTVTAHYEYDHRGRKLGGYDTFKGGQPGRFTTEVYDNDGNDSLHSESNFADTVYWDHYKSPRPPNATPASPSHPDVVHWYWDDYKLDSHGNWVERYQLLLDPKLGQPRTVKMQEEIQYRTIEYYSLGRPDRASPTAGGAPERRPVLGHVAVVRERSAIHAEKNDASETLHLVKSGERLIVSREEPKWAGVLMSGGGLGWIRESAVTITSAVAVTAGGASSAFPTTIGGQAAVEARKYLTSQREVPREVARRDSDGSGFVKTVFDEIGVSLPRTASQQTLVGTAISMLDDLKPGDRLFFCDKARTRITRTAIYIGSGNFVVRSRAGGVVRGSLFDKKWRQALVSAKRSKEAKS